MEPNRNSSAPFMVLTVVFLALACLFAFGGGHGPLVSNPGPLVDASFLDTSPNRKSYADLAREKADLSDFDCYTCHEKAKPPQIRYDNDHNIVVPKEHESVVMGHGTHNRNNNCYNCHDESNLERLQARDRRELTFSESTQLCGSCHGPTYRDYEAGVHGRTSGHWLRAAGEFKRLDCVNCHNPHSPKFPKRKPAPGPHPLRGSDVPSAHAVHVEPSH